MKVSIWKTGILAVVVALTIFSCAKDTGNELDEWDIICNGLTGGEVNLTVENEDWKSNCVLTTYQEISDSGLEQKILSMVIYNNGITFFSDTEIEAVILTWSENILDGETTIIQGAAFYKGYYDYELATTDPDYEAEEIAVYFSDTDNNAGEINITQLNSSTASGNLSFELFEETTGERIEIGGSFIVNIEE